MPPFRPRHPSIRTWSGSGSGWSWQGMYVLFATAKPDREPRLSRGFRCVAGALCSVVFGCLACNVLHVPDGLSRTALSLVHLAFGFRLLVASHFADRVLNCALRLIVSTFEVFLVHEESFLAC